VLYPPRIPIIPRAADSPPVEFIDRNILDEANIKLIEEDIVKLIESATQPKMVISFADVEHLSSAALGTLITVNNKIKARSGKLRLANIDPQILEVFVITRLNKLFEIHPSSAAALKSLS